MFDYLVGSTVIFSLKIELLDLGLIIVGILVYLALNSLNEYLELVSDNDEVKLLK